MFLDCTGEERVGRKGGEAPLLRGKAKMVTMTLPSEIILEQQPLDHILRLEVLYPYSPTHPRF